MSTLYVPRPGVAREDLPELKRHSGLTACVVCDGAAIASVLEAIALRYATPEETTA
jgi:hypothetical protein